MKKDDQTDHQKLMDAFARFEWEQERPFRFGARLRQIRKELGETQDEFAARIGTSKQVLSRYEKGDRIPKVSLLDAYARSLHVSVDYLMGNTDEKESAFHTLCRLDGKPFYQVFLEVMNDMDLTSLDVCRITGLKPWQVQAIVERRIEEVPLPTALQLSKSLGVPLEVWAGSEDYKPGDLNMEAREVAMAYDKASDKDKAVVRTVLDLPPMGGST